MVGYELLAQPSAVNVVRAPGRVNLIGDHTDYNGGFALPVAIDRSVTVTSRWRTDRTVTVYSAQLDEFDEFEIDHIERTGTWRDYVRGVLALLRPPTGADVEIRATLPRGSGLSSSAALELAVARTFSDLPADELARLAQRAENEFVGVQCGILDQFTSAMGRAGHALFLDCRDLSFRHVPLPGNASVVICDSGVRRELASSAYNDRRRSCEAAARQLGVPSLREATFEDVEKLPVGLKKCARHVISENARTRAAAEALDVGNVALVGRVMNESHASLRDDYDVVPRAVGEMVDALRRVDGCYGARMTGAGFGGALVSLVAEAAVGRFVAAAADAGGAAFACHAADGVRP